MAKKKKEKLLVRVEFNAQGIELLDLEVDNLRRSTVREAVVSALCGISNFDGFGDVEILYFEEDNEDEW